MAVSGLSLIGLLVLAGIVAFGLAPARPQVTLGFAALVVGVGAVLTLASEPQGAMTPLGIVVAVTGLVVGAVAVRRDATSTQSSERDRAPRL